MPAENEERPIGVLIEQYDLTLTKREMDELMLVVRMFVRSFEASPLAVDMHERLEELYQGGGAGLGVSFRAATTEDVIDDEEEA